MLQADAELKKKKVIDVACMVQGVTRLPGHTFPINTSIFLNYVDEDSNFPVWSLMGLNLITFI